MAVHWSSLFVLFFSEACLQANQGSPPSNPPWPANDASSITQNKPMQSSTCRNFKKAPHAGLTGQGHAENVKKTIKPNAARNQASGVKKAKESRVLRIKNPKTSSKSLSIAAPYPAISRHILVIYIILRSIGCSHIATQCHTPVYGWSQWKATLYSGSGLELNTYNKLFR